MWQLPVYCLTAILVIKTFGDRRSPVHQCSFDHRCNCNGTNVPSQLEIANCSHRNISTIPTMNSFVLQLDLSFNEIDEIKVKTFQACRVLTKLDLSNNNINVIYTLSFEGLFHLQILNLKGNKLVYKENIFQDHCFRPLRSLRILNIENNIGFYTAGQIYPKLSDLHSLETLVMDGVQDPKLSNKLENLTHLTSLNISNQSGKCVIESLEEEVFTNNPNLKTIELIGCKLKRIKRGTFHTLRHLHYLDLSYNENLHFDGAVDLSYDLQFTTIKILKLNKIYDTFHLNIKIPYNFGKPLRNTSLTELHVDSNRIQLMDIGVLPNFPPSLSVLSAADNAFSFGHYLYETLSMNVSTLNVSNLYATHDIGTGRINKRSSTTRNVGSIENWNRWIYSMVSRDTQKHDYNSLAILRSIGERFDVNPHIPVPKYLQKLYINRSLLRFSIPHCTYFDNSLEHVDASENLVTEWIGPILNIRKLIYLDFSKNFCSNISEYFFQNLSSIETLLINNNLLGFVLPSDTEGKIFSALRNLKNIDLSQNRINFLPKLLFKSQTALQKLDLSSNMLTDISFDLSGFSNLSFIDLSNNHISSVGVDVMADLDGRNKQRHLTIDLSNNPLQCNCDTIQFVKWFMATDVTILKLKTYECLQQDKSKTTLKNPDQIYKKLLKICSNYNYLIAGITAALILFLFIVICSIIYRYRWKLRYIYYMTKQRYRNYDALINVSHDYKYDAFISYADEDQDFVHGEMLTKLEGNFSFKLCLHSRDFVPGRDIAGNITNAIHTSRRTVIVMSTHFIQSYWCMFEFNMARMESLYSREGERVLFLLLYEEVPAKELPLVFLEHYQSQSYIAYPHDDVGNDIFWMKMKEALQ